ncbi:helix-turn-helix domain-containing protein [Demequina capsici]|uniref:Helix-turn-helix domain-containing protein n=1 Tax=Demequina capsici TaxID=3075620 RepID=A0AA96FBK0_9MICO|nr:MULTISPECIES: helix-turn-helix domain-containing protein [unclassified Demequina]WNM25265.1 helix-turn-helix domain-containing protein [Demequina sp. OYTSA14]WNM28162.1 helix-turn-helix domain-containing protein [Demequina sp. PMTSA13]
MTVDPRFARSAGALEAAILQLAAERPIEDLTVSEIARAAHVSRATFYNHADSPEELLARVLIVDLDAVRGDFLRGAVTTDIVDQWRSSEVALMSHVLDHEDVYRTGLAPTQANRGTALAAILARHFEATMLQYAEAVAPRLFADPSQRLRLEMEAAFASHGLVGAIRAWLLSPAPRDREVASEILVEATPRYWFEITELPQR